MPRLHDAARCIRPNRRLRIRAAGGCWRSWRPASCSRWLRGSARRRSPRSSGPSGGWIDSGCRSSRSPSSSGSSWARSALAVTGRGRRRVGAGAVRDRGVRGGGREPRVRDAEPTTSPRRCRSGSSPVSPWPASIRSGCGCSPAGSAASAAWPSGCSSARSRSDRPCPTCSARWGPARASTGRPRWRSASARRDRGRDRRPGRGVGRAVGRAGPPVQLRCGAVGLPAAVGPPGQSRLPRSHVGALRDVDLGPAVHRGELRRGRQRAIRRAPAWPPSRSSVPGGSAASRPGSSPIASGGRP